MKLDVLVFAAHPDDAELSMGGTIAKLTHHKHKVGIIDLTKGELGTRGNEAIRKEEAENAAQILGVVVRENLGLADGFFEPSSAGKPRNRRASSRVSTSCRIRLAITSGFSTWPIRESSVL